MSTFVEFYSKVVSLNRITFLLRIIFHACIFRCMATFRNMHVENSNRNGTGDVDIVKGSSDFLVKFLSYKNS